MLILIRDKVDVDYLLKIDKKIAAMAKAELENIKFGLKNKINNNDLEVLINLRDIFVSKSYCSDCLNDIPMEQIKFLIDKNTNSCYG